MSDHVRILAVSGSGRSGSTNTAFCRTAAAFPPTGVTVTAFDDVLRLPLFDPDLDADPVLPEVAALRAAIADSDAVLFCTPEYAGTLPAAMKNLLEWTVGSTVLTDRPVCWVGVAADVRRGEGAHAVLATVLGYVQARVVSSACTRVPIARDQVGEDGLVTEPAVRARITAAVSSLAAEAAQR